jgi:hypothetical protein
MSLNKSLEMNGNDLEMGMGSVMCVMHLQLEAEVGVGGVEVEYSLYHTSTYLHTQAPPKFK